jgi:hypothetical protein
MQRGLVCVVVLLASCYSTPQPPCAFRCGASGACPDDYACSSDDGRCHLKQSGGGLAACLDTLPADAASIDAPAIDAPMIDASGPPDADLPPTLDAIATPVNAVAGDVVNVVASALDPDAPPEVLTFTAPYAGTHQDPYQDLGGGDTVGGSFGGHTFTLAAGVLGDFDVDVTVCDTLPSCDHQVVTIHVDASPVRIDEIIFQTVEDIELINTSGAAVDVGGWKLEAPLDGYVLDAGTTIGAHGFLLIHWNQPGTDSATDKFTCNHAGGCALATLASTKELALFGADTVLSRDLRDFVKWGTGPFTVVTRAVRAGQWPSANASDDVDTTGLVDGASIARTIGANTESAADFVIDATPTPGAANTP